MKGGEGLPLAPNGFLAKAVLRYPFFGGITWRLQ